MAIPAEAPLSTSVTLFGPLPLAISAVTAVAAGATETSSRKTCWLLPVSRIANASGTEPPVPITVNDSCVNVVGSCDPVSEKYGVPFQLAEKVPLPPDEASTQKLTV